MLGGEKGWYLGLILDWESHREPCSSVPPSGWDSFPFVIPIWCQKILEGFGGSWETFWFSSCFCFCYDFGFVNLYLFMLWAKPLFKKLILTFNILFHIICVMNSYFDVNIKSFFVSVDSKFCFFRGKKQTFLWSYTLITIFIHRQQHPAKQEIIPWHLSIGRPSTSQIKPTTCQSLSANSVKIKAKYIFFFTSNFCSHCSRFWLHVSQMKVLS